MTTYEEMLRRNVEMTFPLPADHPVVPYLAQLTTFYVGRCEIDAGVDAALSFALSNLDADTWYHFLGAVKDKLNREYGLNVTVEQGESPGMWHTLYLHPLDMPEDQMCALFRIDQVVWTDAELVSIEHFGDHFTETLWAVPLEWATVDILAAAVLGVYWKLTGHAIMVHNLEGRTK